MGCWMDEWMKEWNDLIPWTLPQVVLTRRQMVGFPLCFMSRQDWLTDASCSLFRWIHTEVWVWKFLVKWKELELTLCSWTWRNNNASSIYWVSAKCTMYLSSSQSFPSHILDSCRVHSFYHGIISYHADSKWNNSIVCVLLSIKVNF